MINIFFYILEQRAQSPLNAEIISICVGDREKVLQTEYN